MKCAMHLFLGYLDGATQFAQSCGGGGGDNSLPWGRKEDEDDRRFAYRCMMLAHKMMKLSLSPNAVYQADVKIFMPDSYILIFFIKFAIANRFEAPVAGRGAGGMT